MANKKSLEVSERLLKINNELINVRMDVQSGKISEINGRHRISILTDEYLSLKNSSEDEIDEWKELDYSDYYEEEGEENE